MSDTSYVRIISTISGSYRNRGVGHNVRNMHDAKDFVTELAENGSGNISQIRIKPMEITFSDAREAARTMSRATGRSW